MNSLTRYDQARQEEALLRAALYGSDEEWSRLYQRCEDPCFAAEFAAVLDRALANVDERVSHWREVLSELHPNWGTGTNRSGAAPAFSLRRLLSSISAFGAKALPKRNRPSSP